MSFDWLYDLFRPVASAAGVDFLQWRALTQAMLRRDFRMRGSTLGRAGRQVTGARALVFQAIFYSLLGSFIAGAFAMAKDTYFVGLFVCAYVMFMTATAVLLDHSSALTAADDYAVLGYRPLSSRTYFAVRLTNVLLYTLLLTTMLIALPAGALFVTKGAAVGAAGLAALYGSSLFIAFALLVSYGTLQRVVGADRLKQVLSVLQLLMSFVFYGGYAVFQHFVSLSFLAGFDFTRTWAIALTPPSWFSSYFALARGDVSAMTLVPIALSIAALIGFSYALVGWLSKGFAERLGASSVAQRSAAKGAAKSSRAGWLFSRGEGRAMALLIRSQFRNDQRFRMGVLTIIPLTVLYIFQGVSRRGTHTDGSEFAFVRFAIMIFPSMLKTQLGQSDSFKASWIFFSAPANRSRLIRAATQVVVVTFLVPYVVLVAAVMAYLSANRWQAIVQVGLVGLMSYLVLQIAVLIQPELPFSRPFGKGQNLPRVMMLAFGILVANVLVQVGSGWLFASVWREAGVAAGILAAAAFVELLAKARIDEQARAFEFAG